MIAARRELARALNGEVSADQVLAPGPGHSRRDRSLAVRMSPSAPDDFIVYSHAGGEWRVCRDHVRDSLGLAPGAWAVARPSPIEATLDAKLLDPGLPVLPSYAVEETREEADWWGWVQTFDNFQDAIVFALGHLEPGGTTDLMNEEGV